MKKTNKYVLRTYCDALKLSLIQYIISVKKRRLLLSNKMSACFPRWYSKNCSVLDVVSKPEKFLDLRTFSLLSRKRVLFLKRHFNVVIYYLFPLTILVIFHPHFSALLTFSFSPFNTSFFYHCTPLFHP